MSTKNYVMRTQIYTVRDLEGFGVDILTGEACALGLRVLCDLTTRGRLTVEAFLGSQIMIAPGSNWNPGSPEDPHVGSVLLTWSTLRDLLYFAVWRRHDETHDWIIRDPDDGWVAAIMNEERQYLDTSKLVTAVTTRYRRELAAARGQTLEETTVGDRNVHTMSGRTV